MSESIFCPSCGASDYKKVEFDTTKQLTLGPEFNYSSVNFQCNVCGAEGDFTLESDTNYSEALKVAESEAIKTMIEQLHEQHLSMAYLERAFELPMRTLTRWKSGDFSTVSLAFLRTIRTYPWIARVAENKFEPNFAKTAVLAETTQILSNVLMSNDSKFVFAISEDDSNVYAGASLTMIKNQEDDEAIDIRPQNIVIGG